METVFKPKEVAEKLKRLESLIDSEVSAAEREQTYLASVENNRALRIGRHLRTIKAENLFFKVAFDKTTFEEYVEQRVDRFKFKSVASADYYILHANVWDMISHLGTEVPTVRQSRALSPLRIRATKNNPEPVQDALIATWQVAVEKELSGEPLSALVSAVKKIGAKTLTEVRALAEQPQSRGATSKKRAFAKGAETSGDVLPSAPNEIAIWMRKHIEPATLQTVVTLLAGSPETEAA